MYHQFIFALLPNYEFRILTEPLSLNRSLTGKTSIKDPIHPMLAKDSRFEVVLAGELSVVWPDKFAQPLVAIFNNCSGHYLPKKWQAIDMVSVMREFIFPDPKTLLLCFAGDGAAIDGTTDINDMVRDSLYGVEKSCCNS